MKTGNYIIGLLIAQINLGAKRRLRYIEIDLHNTYLDILNILYKQGVIRTFVIKKNRIWIYIKYNMHRPVIKIEIISKPGHKIQMTLKKLSLIYNKQNFSGFYIISTQKGLVSSDHCLLYEHISGEVLCKIII